MRETELQQEDRKRLAAARWLPAVGPFTALGRSWTVQTDEPELAALLTELYADLAASEDATEVDATFRIVDNDGGQRSLVTRDQVRLGGGCTPAATMSTLVWSMSQWVLREASQDHLLIHAAGVVCNDGVALVLPGPSESGKSTLTMELLNRGLGYLSDEAVAIGADGTVQGYAKPISIDRGSWEVLAAHRPDPSGVGAAHLVHQWHIRASIISRVTRFGSLGAVIFPRYHPTAEASITRLGPSSALLLACESTIAPNHGPVVELDQIRDLAAVLGTTPAHVLTFRNPNEACDLVEVVLEELFTPDPAKQLG